MKLFIKITIIFQIFSFSAMADYTNIETYDDHIKQLNKIEINGNTIAYIDEGQGQPIVLMHGIPTNSWLFRKIIPGLVQAGYRVIAPDLLGMGQSDKLKNKEALLVPMQAKVIKNLLVDKLHLTNISLVVHDFGGPISFEMLEDNTLKVDELFILDTFAFREGFNPGLNMFSKVAMKVLASKPLRKRYFRLAIKSMVMNKEDSPKEMLNGYLQPLLNGGSYTYKKLYFSVNKLRSSENLARYQETLLRQNIEKVKIIWGENDKFLDSTLQLNAFKELLNVPEENILVLEDTRHLITEEEPEKILEMILK